VTQRPRKPLRADGPPPGAAPKPPREPKPRKPKARKAASGGGSLAGTLLRWSLIAALWGGIVLAGIIAWFALDLPDVKNLNVIERRPSVTLVTADGSVVATVGDLYSDPAVLAKLPKHVPLALLATEDRRFYSHFGVDLLGLMRAVWVNVRSGRMAQGGSTITQQLAKNVFLTPQRNLKRKVQEVLLALWLENNYSKDQILEMYLNRVYFGAGTYGIESAAQRYFAKPATQLSLPEAAMLVGMLKAPSRYSPIANLKLSQARANQVIANMEAFGAINEAVAKQAVARPATVARSRIGTRNTRYFADWVLESISDYAGRRREDLIVTVTLDLRLQQAAERAVETLLARDGERLDVEQAALVALSPDGAVLAMVGGRDYRDSEFNRVTQAHRQPGSAFKPFVFLAGLESGMRPDSIVEDRPITVANWTPRNFEPNYLGAITLREALARSINTVAVQVSEQAGRPRVIEAARRLGIISPLAPHPSIALGASEVTPLELTAAYAPFANGGSAVPPVGIREIRTRGGEVLFRGEVQARPVIDPVILGQMNDMLSAVVQIGSGRATQLDRPSGGKTGTSSDFRDAWFVGYTADIVAGVWVGNDDNTPMKRVAGSGLPAQIWKSFMQEAVRGVPTRPLQTPDVIAQRDQEHRTIWDRILGRFGTAAPQPTLSPAPSAPPARVEANPYDR
jgi:penicillin-binding protein 1A